MAVLHDPALREVSILFRAFELVFRKLIRLLIGRISLKKIQEMILIIFVEEAEASLQKENPGQSVALGDLSRLADVDTRTIKKARTYIALSTPLYEDTDFIKELSPETCVLDTWDTNPKYKNPETGKPMILAIRGDEGSFEGLIRETTSTNGPTIDSFLRHLTDCGSVEVLPGGNEVRLLKSQYTSFASSDDTTGLKIGLSVVSNLLDTITHNLRAPARGDGPFYQRGCWSTRLSRKDRDKLRKLTRKFLAKSDEKARELIGQYERNQASKEHVTAGISMFYFEEEKAA